jgi:hypothetical protein
MLPPEQDLVAHFVEFLNLAIESTEDVEQLFAEAALVAGPMRIRPDETQRYRELQDEMVAAMAPLATVFGHPISAKRTAQALAVTVREKLADMPPPLAVFQVREDGTFGITYALNGVAQCCWVAVGLLIDPTRLLPGRLGRCGAPGCHRFVVSFERRPRRHCDTAHADAFKALTITKRVRRHRKRKREAEERARAARAAHNKED